MASEKVTALLNEIKAMSFWSSPSLSTPSRKSSRIRRRSAAVAVAAAPAAAVVEEKTEFDVVLAEFGAEKIKVIKVVPRDYRTGPGRSQGSGRSRS